MHAAQFHGTPLGKTCMVVRVLAGVARKAPLLPFSDCIHSNSWCQDSLRSHLVLWCLRNIFQESRFTTAVPLGNAYLPKAFAPVPPSYFEASAPRPRRPPWRAVVRRSQQSSRHPCPGLPYCRGASRFRGIGDSSRRGLDPRRSRVRQRSRRPSGGVAGLPPLRLYTRVPSILRHRGGSVRPRRTFARHWPHPAP